MISEKDRNVIRELAAKWMELASLPVMNERKRLWKAVHDLKAQRPVILFETAWIEDFVATSEILCEDPFLRTVEQNMRITLRQAEELEDDLVVEPYYRLGWKMIFSDYGVPVEIHSSIQQPESIAYRFNFPIATPADISKLKKRVLSVDRAKTGILKETLEDVMGDILPVVLGNYDPFAYEFNVGEFGDLGFNGTGAGGALFSLAPGSASLLQTPNNLSAADIFFTDFNGSFTTYLTAADIGLLHDDNVDALPEPATLTLLAVGGLAMLRRRRK